MYIEVSINDLSLSLSLFLSLSVQVNLFHPEDDVTRRLLVRLHELLQQIEETDAKNERENDEGEGSSDGEEGANAAGTSNSKGKQWQHYRGDYLHFTRKVSVS